MTAQAIRIGTRESKLALFQARQVQQALKEKGVQTELVEITSEGDLDLETPLYEMGIQGIFTRSLDVALLNNRIDIAVHSAKDIPTKLAKGLALNGVLKRGSPVDCLVLPSGQKEITLEKAATIASSSLRRRTQWLHRYPHHVIVNLRGNIQTRLEKLDQNNWQGAIFAQTALERLQVTTHQYITLNWMLPAPAQGAIAIVGRQEDSRINEICGSINHTETLQCISAERDFLAALHGGCAVPIAAHAEVQKNKIHFIGNIFSLDATQKREVDLTLDIDQADQIGNLAAKEILLQGGDAIIKTFRDPS